MRKIHMEPLRIEGNYVWEIHMVKACGIWPLDLTTPHWIDNTGLTILEFEIWTYRILLRNKALCTRVYIL